jgi:transposase
VRATTVFNKLLQLVGAWVTGVEFVDEGGVVVVDVRLRRRLLVCPECGWSTAARHNWQPRPSTWRALDFGTWRVIVRCRLRRLECRPCGRVVVEAVPFARHRARFTRDFEDVVAWLAQRCDKTSITQLCRVNWRTVGAVIERVVADQLDDSRLDGLYRMGVDEVSYRKQHHYLTLITNHDLGKVIDARPGKTATVLTGFFDDLGEDRCRAIEAISADMGPAYLKAIREHDHIDATVCIDPFHVMLNANKALDVVRRGYWNELRERAGPDDARKFKHARWALLKRPEHLTDTQAAQLAAIKRAGGAVWRAHQLVQALRAIFDPDLTPTEAEALLDRFLAWASRSRLPSFVKLGRTVRKHHAGILATLEVGIDNGRAEGLNTKVRTVTSRAYGFHSATAAAAMVMLTCGPVTITLPHQQQRQ